MYEACSLWVVVVPVDGEEGYCNIEIWIFIIHRGKSGDKDDEEMGEVGARDTHEYPPAFPSSGSLSNSI